MSSSALEPEESLRKLAQIAVFGANVQSGQLLGIETAIGKEELTRAIARAAYERGARYVDALYFDIGVKRYRLELAAGETLDYVPPWQRQRLLQFSDERAAIVKLRGPQELDALASVDPARAGRDPSPTLPEWLEIGNRRTTNWCNIPAPTSAWASRVYPEMDGRDAYLRLWREISHVCRLDGGDPEKAWTERIESLSDKARDLNGRQFDAIRLHGEGTDLAIGLLPSAIWQPAALETVDGITHIANIPTEEVFTTPDPARVDGYVRGTKPIDLHGTLVAGIRLQFEGGRAIRIDAEKGADALRALSSRDEGACRLGELALVDGAGRIGPLGTVFFTALLDENAATHIALGNGIDFAVNDEADRARINRSSIHVDLMIGSRELAIDGITRDGQVVPVLREGVWQI